METHDTVSFHLAGIIPVSGQDLDFNMPWHDSLMPIAQNYLAVERAAVECAYAGCETIWVVCHDDMQPLIRHRLGDWVSDPVWEYRKWDRFPSERKKDIPIFYVPISVNDRGKRDCLSWSVLYGALTAYKTAHMISKWVTPDKYYVAFPYGVYQPWIVKPYRKHISHKNRFYLTHEGESVINGKYLSFTFNGEDFKMFRDHLRKKATGMYTKGGPGVKNETLPIEERYSARLFGLEDVFNIARVDKNTKLFEVPWYFSIDSWDKYCYYITSDERSEVKRPSKRILHYHEFNPIGDREGQNDDESGDI